MSVERPSPYKAASEHTSEHKGYTAAVDGVNARSDETVSPAAKGVLARFSDWLFSRTSTPNSTKIHGSHTIPPKMSRFKRLGLFFSQFVSRNPQSSEGMQFRNSSPLKGGRAVSQSPEEIQAIKDAIGKLSKGKLDISSFDALMNTEEGRNAVNMFCERTYIMENFNYILKMEEFNQLINNPRDSGRIKNASKEICDQFIKAGAKEQINIGGALRAQILMQFDNENPDPDATKALLDKARNQVLIQCDVIAGFAKSPQFAALQEKYS